MGLTSAKLGINNSIMTWFLEMNNSVYVNVCPYHIVHNTTSKCASSFSLETGFLVVSMLVNVYHYFDKSSKRKGTLNEFCKFMEQEYKKTINYISTCWLSLESAVTRCLEQYPLLKFCFLSEDKIGYQRFDKLFWKFSNLMTEVLMYFYQFLLQSFIRFNFYVQQEDPLISKLHAEIHRFLKYIACKFWQD